MFENFSWKAGTQFPVKASVAAATIRSLQEALGKDFITAKELLDESRDENAPLHCCFEWDDTIAAEKYRVDQARRIINSIEVKVIHDDKSEIKTRFFLNVQPVAPKKPGEFVGIDRVLSNENYRKQALSNALIELRAFQRKYTAYEELSGVFKAIDDFGGTFQ